MKQSGGFTHVYNGPGGNGPHAVHQRKMMMKNQNQLRSSYNSVSNVGQGMVNAGAYQTIGANDSKNASGGFSVSRSSQLSHKIIPQNVGMTGGNNLKANKNTM